MSKAEDFIKEEKEHYGKIYVDISYAIDNISPFIGDDIKKRRYSAKLSPLKKYIDLIDSADSEVSKSGLFGMFKDEKYIDLLKSYKMDNLELLNNLENCSRCKCLNCVEACTFSCCAGCRDGARIADCDHKRINVTLHDSFMLNLTNNETGEDDRYKVLATLEDIEKDKRYIITLNIHTNDKYILYYYPGIKEDTFGEITDEDEFDFIASTFQNIEE